MTIRNACAIIIYDDVDCELEFAGCEVDMENEGNKKYIIDENFVKVIKELIDKALAITVAVPAKMTAASAELESISVKTLRELISIEPYEQK